MHPTDAPGPARLLCTDGLEAFRAAYPDGRRPGPAPLFLRRQAVQGRLAFGGPLPGLLQPRAAMERQLTLGAGGWL